MKKYQIAKRLAVESGISTAAAADQLDTVFAGILKRLRNGHSASLPGLGTFLAGASAEFSFDHCLPPGARRTKQKASR